MKREERKKRRKGKKKSPPREAQKVGLSGAGAPPETELGGAGEVVPWFFEKVALFFAF